MSKKEKPKEKKEESPAEKASKDAWQVIHSFLSPEDGAELSRVSKKLYRASKSQQLWWERFLRDFPHHYHRYKDYYDYAEEVNYKEVYKECYEYDYQNLKYPELFSWVKVGELDEIKNFKPQKEYLFKEDVQGLNIIQWAVILGRQNILDYFFDVLNRGTRKEKKESIVKNAIICHQNLHEIDSELLVKNLYAARDLAIPYANQQALNMSMWFGHPSFDGGDLYLAASCGFVEIVSLLLESGVENDSAIHAAVEKGHINVINLLLKDKSLLEAPGKWGYTPLLTAIENNQPTVVKLLLDHGANIKADVDGMQAIQIAAENENFNVVSLLLEYDSSLINVLDNEGRTPITGFSSGMTWYLLEYAISNSIELSPENIQWGLVVAWGDANVEYIETFLALGADPYENYRNDLPYVFDAVANGNLELLKLLLEHDKELLELKDSDGRGLLFHAIKENNKEIIDYLVAQGASLLEKDNNGQTPLHYAVECKHDYLVEYLLEKGADPLATDNEGKTPIAQAYDAIWAEQRRCMQTFWPKYEDFTKTIKTQKMQRCLQLFDQVDAHRNNVIKEKRKCVNEKDGLGYTLLHHAIMKKSKELMLFLLNEGADPLAKYYAKRNAITKVRDVFFLVSSEKELKKEFIDILKLYILKQKYEHAHYKHKFKFFGHSVRYRQSIKRKMYAINYLIKRATEDSECEPNEKELHAIRAPEFRTIAKHLGVLLSTPTKGVEVAKK